jgi:hypothetical protein
MKECNLCQKTIELFVQNGNDYTRNKCCVGDELCYTMIDAWKKYWTEKYELAKLRERALRYSKGIKDD